MRKVDRVCGCINIEVLCPCKQYNSYSSCTCVVVIGIVIQGEVEVFMKEGEDAKTRID